MVGDEVIADRDRPTYDPGTLHASQGLKTYHRWVVHTVAPSIRGRTLEFGAGTGTISRLLEPLCTELVLVERAVNLWSGLSESFADCSKVKVLNGTLESLAEDYPAEVRRGFDTVASFNVLEHIEDDGSAVRAARDLLSPGGRMVLFVPSLPCLYGTLDSHVGHLRRYTKKSLLRLIESVGLEVERLQYFDFFGVLPWFIVGRVLRRTEWGEDSGVLSLYDRLVTPISRGVDALIGPPVGKNLIAVSRRPER